MLQSYITVRRCCIRPSHTRKVANTSKSSTLATRSAAYTRAQVVSFFPYFIKLGIKSEIDVWGTYVHGPMVFGPSGISSIKGWRVRLRVQSCAGAGVVYLSVKKKRKLFSYIILLVTSSLARLNLFVVSLFLIVLSFFFNFFFYSDNTGLNSVVHLSTKSPAYDLLSKMLEYVVPSSYLFICYLTSLTTILLLNLVLFSSSLMFERLNWVPEIILICKRHDKHWLRWLNSRTLSMWHQPHIKQSSILIISFMISL